LIGDAAHAIVPYHAQGAAQSIEDAYLLYKHLKKNNLDFNIQNFQKIRKKRILEVEKRSNINQFIFHLSNNSLKFLRKNILKFLLKNKIFLKIYFNKLFNYKP
jgi:salicylate hydroxylase